jgi:hypothetical protein
MVCAVESYVSKLADSGHGIQREIRSTLEKSKSFVPNTTIKELKAMKSLKLNIDIRIL